MEWLYLVSLVVSIGGMLVLDQKYKLAFWRDARRTGLTMIATISFFIIWDIAGIALGIFSSGGSRYALDFMLAPEFPVEELLFLFLLCYLTLISFQGVAHGLNYLRRP